MAASILSYEISGVFDQSLPIVNTNASFTILSIQTQANTIVVQFLYDAIKNINGNDGLILYNTTNYTIINIYSFGGIPLSRLGQQFRNYQGSFPTNDFPLILDNTNGNYMFSETTFNQPLDNWNVSGITSMSYMFSFSSFNQSLNNWNINNVNDISYIFLNCFGFNGNIGNWNTINIKSMDGSFINCNNFNQDLSNWIVSNVTSMKQMFESNLSFNQSLNTWNISNVTSLNAMLDNTALSVDNYDATLNGWSNQQVQSNVILGAQGLEYSSTGEVGRNILTNNYNWTINGDSLICFIKDTMILILENGIEVERKVQELKNGDMVKISTGEYKKLVFIGTKTIDITKI